MVAPRVLGMGEGAGEATPHLVLVLLAPGRVLALRCGVAALPGDVSYPPLELAVSLHSGGGERM